MVGYIRGDLMKKKEKERSKELFRQRQEDDMCFTIIKDGRIIVQNGKPIKNKN